MAGHLFTSESVTEGHPDKVCDIVSDSVLDAILAQDPRARVACETMVKTGFVAVAGEITTTAVVDVPKIVRKAVCDIGYTDSSMGFDGNTCAILTAVEQQSPDIAQGVSEGEGLYKEQGAGDQGLMFGFAVDETPELMPMPIDMAHRLAHRLSSVRKKGKLAWLRPDGKTQVTVEYEGGKPKRIDAIVVSTQHADGVKHKTIVEAIKDEVIAPVIPKSMVDKNTKYWINPTGRFVVGGPCGDAGLTGRKIIVDSYGGMGRHGGGAFSGKDPSKVDRSAAYYARFVAKNIVASGAATRCEVQVAYAIGVAQPMGVYVTTFGTGKVGDERIAEVVKSLFDFRPRALIDELALLAPRYRPTAAYGHFGRSEPSFTWEKTARADELRDALFGKPGKGKKVAPAAEPTDAEKSKSDAKKDKADAKKVKADSRDAKKGKKGKKSKG